MDDEPATETEWVEEEAAGLTEIGTREESKTGLDFERLAAGSALSRFADGSGKTMGVVDPKKLAIKSSTEA